MYLKYKAAPFCVSRSKTFVLFYSDKKKITTVIVYATCYLMSSIICSHLLFYPHMIYFDLEIIIFSECTFKKTFS